MESSLDEQEKEHPKPFWSILQTMQRGGDTFQERRKERSAWGPEEENQVSRLPSSICSTGIWKVEPGFKSQLPPPWCNRLGCAVVFTHMKGKLRHYYLLGLPWGVSEVIYKLLLREETELPYSSTMQDIELGSFTEKSMCVYLSVYVCIYIYVHIYMRYIYVKGKIFRRYLCIFIYIY